MSEKIRILHITTTLNSNGGIEETIRILCRRLDPNRFRIGLCSIQDRPLEILEEFRQMDVEIFCIGRKGYFFDFITISQIKNVIKKFKADIVHTHTDKGNFHGRLAAFLSPKVCIVTTFHSLENMAFSKTPELKKRLSELFDVKCARHQNYIYMFVYPFFNIILNQLNSKVITVSNTIRKIYSYNPDNTLYETVYAPYDHTIFKSHYRGFNGKYIILGTVARLERQKGHFYLLQALSKLIKTRKDILLKIIGDGSLKKDIELFIKKNCLEPFVLLCGKLPHDTSLYDDIDIYIQPSIIEGCSITLLEAMGSGIPIIASDIDGPRELIIPDKTGILVPPKNPEALKDAILELIGNKELAFKLGRAGRERAINKFSSKIFAEKMFQIYQKLVIGGKEISA